MCLEVRYILTNYIVKTVFFDADISLRLSTKVEPHASATTASNSRREAKFNQTSQKWHQEQAVVRRPKLFSTGSVASVKTLPTHARYSSWRIYAYLTFLTCHEFSDSTPKTQNSFLYFHILHTTVRKHIGSNDKRYKTQTFFEIIRTSQTKCCYQRSLV